MRNPDTKAHGIGPDYTGINHMVAGGPQKNEFIFRDIGGLWLLYPYFFWQRSSVCKKESASVCNKMAAGVHGITRNILPS